MLTTNKVGNAFDGAAQRYDNWSVECQQFKEYLAKNNATATMASTALNIYRPSACRYKRWLQAAGQLWEVKKGVCTITGFPAMYLTTNPDHKPKDPQTSLFGELEGERDE